MFLVEDDEIMFWDDWLHGSRVPTPDSLGYFLRYIPEMPLWRLSAPP